VGDDAQRALYGSIIYRAHHAVSSNMRRFRSLLARFERRQRPEDRRQALIDRKHATMSEIRMLQREIGSLRARGVDVGDREARLERLQSEHYQLRLKIDRTRP
jgi:hypothetical protein